MELELHFVQSLVYGIDSLHAFRHIYILEALTFLAKLKFFFQGTLDLKTSSNKG
jgi:hypothetical protein